MRSSPSMGPLPWLLTLIPSYLRSFLRGAARVGPGAAQEPELVEELWGRVQACLARTQRLSGEEAPVIEINELLQLRAIGYRRSVSACFPLG